MSDLIPNLDDLCAQVQQGGCASDVHAFLDELAVAATVDDAAGRIDALVDRWLEVPDVDTH